MGARIFADALKPYAKEGKSAVLMSLNQTHLLGSFDQVSVLSEGWVIAQGSPEEVSEANR